MKKTNFKRMDRQTLLRKRFILSVVIESLKDAIRKIDFCLNPKIRPKMRKK